MVVRTGRCGSRTDCNAGNPGRGGTEWPSSQTRPVSGSAGSTIHAFAVSLATRFSPPCLVPADLVGVLPDGPADPVTLYSSSGRQRRSPSMTTMPQRTSRPNSTNDSTRTWSEWAKAAASAAGYSLSARTRVTQRVVSIHGLDDRWQGRCGRPARSCSSPAEHLPRRHRNPGSRDDRPGQGLVGSESHHVRRCCRHRGCPTGRTTPGSWSCRGCRTSAAPPRRGPTRSDCSMACGQGIDLADSDGSARSGSPGIAIAHRVRRARCGNRSRSGSAVDSRQSRA